MKETPQEASTNLPGWLRREAGFTIVETLTAAAILTIAMVAFLTSMTYGLSGMDRGRKATTAVLLAEQRLEQIKSFALSGAITQGWANVTAANFPAEAYGTITSYTEYRRTVTITDVPDADGIVRTKQVEVFVFYKATGANGLNQETSVGVSTLMVAH
jgi:type II secretory pathway pseudopilin PulG